MFKPRKPVNRRKKLEEENGVDMEIEGNYDFLLGFSKFWKNRFGLFLANFTAKNVGVIEMCSLSKSDYIVQVYSIKFS